MAPGGAAGGENDLDEHLFAPFADVGFDDGVGAGYAGVAVVPVGGEVVDGAKIGVDGELVAGGVVAGGLVFEVAGGAGGVAG